MLSFWLDEFLQNSVMSLNPVVKKILEFLRIQKLKNSLVSSFGGFSLWLDFFSKLSGDELLEIELLVVFDVLWLLFYLGEGLVVKLLFVNVVGYYS